HHSKVVEPAGRAENGFSFDALNYAESVIWVNDLVANLECHTSPTAKGRSGRNSRMKQPTQYTRGSPLRQGKRPESRVFLRISADRARRPGGALGARPHGPVSLSHRL